MKKEARGITRKPADADLVNMQEQDPVLQATKQLVINPPPNGVSQAPSSLFRLVTPEAGYRFVGLYLQWPGDHPIGLAHRITGW